MEFWQGLAVDRFQGRPQCPVEVVRIVLPLDWEGMPRRKSRDGRGWGSWIMDNG